MPVIPTEGLSMIVIFRLLVILIGYPGIDKHKVGHETWDVAFHYGSIATQNILVHDIHRITLENHWKTQEIAGGL